MTPSRLNADLSWVGVQIYSRGSIREWEVWLGWPLSDADRAFNCRLRYSRVVLLWASIATPRLI
ncbi:hypothetical protein BO71DRAFT_403361 [Aspergillus ellipticus CBS 707.79]|uniref:Uncharacterized protein n=1 Tax=Aspergillus ellipticus CBS 707.79 TaxID=1448320 RepID=A0A319DLT1_9EURO|nr:hypothetical protein BO71DRAFT_403361 [Aspergillus ellipticus CBS 707.79]